ncbi:MAG: PEGA domain-containing protein [Candidatus Levyibacteriota bacterium]
MKKVLFFIIPLIILAGGILFFMIYASKSTAKGALQVTSIPKSTVYLDDKVIGQTPLCKCSADEMLEEGDYTIRLVPADGVSLPFEEKITISKSIMTVVDRTFSNGTSEGSIISLSPLQDAKMLLLSVVSFPDNAQVFLDGNSIGNTPFSTKDLTESDHELKLSKSGYSDKTIRIRTVLGYKLSVLVFLGVNFASLNSPTPLASPSAVISKKIIILKTPTGFLRIRQEASITSAELGRVYLNEIFELVDEKTGWFKIKLSDGSFGWISSGYAKKQ